MTDETRWAEDTKLFERDVRLLEHRNGVNLYKVQRWVLNSCSQLSTADTFHVWKNGQHICSTLNYLEAVRAWERESSE